MGAPRQRSTVTPKSDVTSRSSVAQRSDVTQRFHVTSKPLDPKAIAAVVSAPECGALAMFIGLVRDHHGGRRVLSLDYQAYEPLAVKAFALIDEEAGEKWPSVSLAIHHRIGRVEIGEASVVIAAASPHRADAFSASRYAIERIKQIAPIWKHEHFDGGEVWVEGATADPHDHEIRQMAFARACS